MIVDWNISMGHACNFFDLGVCKSDIEKIFLHQWLSLYNLHVFVILEEGPFRNVHIVS